MWISQTYLGCPDPDAKAFVYYFWEEYKEQKDVPAEILARLADMGRSFGSEVSLFAPIPDAQHEIRSELRNQGYDFFWGEIGPKTPGLLLTTKPLAQLEPHKDDYVFFPLQRVRKEVENVFLSLHQACEEIRSKNNAKAESNNLRAIYDSLLLQPNFFGIGIDLKAIITHFRRP